MKPSLVVPKSLKPGGTIGICTPSIPGYAEFSGARNVANLYKLVAQDIRTGSRSAPTFEDALELHELIERIEMSAGENE